MSWQDVEIRSDAAGKPMLVLHGEVKRHADELGIVTSFVSLSHAVDYAVAQVMLCTAELS